MKAIAGAYRVSGCVRRPMLLSTGKQAFTDNNWIFELKYDGYRAVSELNGLNVRLYSRHGKSFLKAYPKIVSVLQQLNLDAVLDGEIVVVDEVGRPSFQNLQGYSKSSKLTLVYYVFDCLEWNGKDPEI